jgi:hypothetical protein
MGAWHKQRVANLRQAALKCHKDWGEDTNEVIAAGMRALDHHRSNYTATHPEPKHLQLLWCEFPPEHWFDLRHGSPMNFLKEPPLGIQPNANMDPSQLETACEFVDKLLDLGAMEEDDPEDPVLANAPMFLLPKPGQPGQWRILADLRAGGQNSAIGSDPTVFPKRAHILNQM